MTARIGAVPVNSLAASVIMGAAFLFFRVRFGGLRLCRLAWTYAGLVKIRTPSGLLSATWHFFLCEDMKDYRTFKEDFLKLVEFAEWYKDYIA